MITTEQMVYEPTPVDGDARFQVAGRLLALAHIVILNKADGMEEERSSTVLRSLAEQVAQYGIDFGRGWLEGWHYTTGTRDHATWMTARRILRDPLWDLPSREIRDQVRDHLLGQILAQAPID